MNEILNYEDSQSEGHAPQRQYRDRLFKAIFGRDTEQSKKWRLELYNALNSSHYTDPDALKLNTDVFFTVVSDVHLPKRKRRAQFKNCENSKSKIHCIL